MIHATIDAFDDEESDGTASPSPRPCGYCGRPVPQNPGAGRPFRYCRDNDDACLRAARNARLRQRNSPGMAGQVAQAFEIVDRLEKVAETLSDALHGELSPQGVDRQLAVVRAEAAAEVAAAHRDRDAATAERDAVRREADQVAAQAVRIQQDGEQKVSAAGRGRGGPGPGREGGGAGR
jgi:hypothetical protein